jgi:hypothetical protein
LDAVHDVEDTEASLERVDRLVEIRSGLFGLQQPTLLLDQGAPELCDAGIERRDVLLHLVRVGLDGEESRDGGDKVLVVVAAYLLDVGILGFY